MDTPQWGDPYFQEAKDRNTQLVAGQTVTLVKDVSEMDRFGRLLRFVYLANGTFVNAELVRQGYAFAATYPPDVAHSATFASLQREAQAASRGLWGVQPTEPPPPTEPPTPTEPPPATPKAAGDVQITYILFDGAVHQVESDEYVVISNGGRSPVNIGGWRLNAGDPRHYFVFPDIDLQHGQSCRVYTNEIHHETCSLSFGSGHEIWSNGGDCGYLYDSAGDEVSTYCY